jgi:hypothetical protein
MGTQACIARQRLVFVTSFHQATVSWFTFAPVLGFIGASMTEARRTQKDARGGPPESDQTNSQATVSENLHGKLFLQLPFVNISIARYNLWELLTGTSKKFQKNQLQIDPYSIGLRPYFFLILLNVLAISCLLTIIISRSCGRITHTMARSFL